MSRPSNRWVLLDGDQNINSLVNSEVRESLSHPIISPFPSYDFNFRTNMESISSRMWHFAVMSMLLVAMCSFTDCYDPLDPNGNVTVTFDIVQWTTDGYMARVTIQNYYQYRHVDNPGWKLGWTWTRNEIILSMSGAFATQQGNCTGLLKPQKPHSCVIDPMILDLPADAKPESMSENCCRGGLLAALAINRPQSFSSFDMTVGNLEGGFSAYKPANLTLMAPGPGYTCGPVEDADPTVSTVIGGKREEQVFRTWTSTCSYSSNMANKTPICCVSLSTFYSPTITSCPRCSCGCRPAGPNTASCIRGGNSLGATGSTDIVQCTDHMCPLRVHWHVKSNYMNHWRVKLTVTNYNQMRNYTDWNVLVQHPGFSQPAMTFSFNNTMLTTTGVPDDIALFWGLEYVNTDLLQADKNQVGSVSTEILLKKDSNSFTLHNGWALPRRIYFAGENCEMPAPDTFPMLPNASSTPKPDSRYFILLFLIYLTFRTLI